MIMDEKLSLLFDAVESGKDTILSAEHYIWQHPEPGWREWKTHAYLKAQYERLGYTLHEAGDVPGFFIDIDTGRPGPKIAVFGEMDAIVVPDHPARDPETCAVHACGHHYQCSALLGVAIALKAPGALDGLCGSIRLIAVPCEEGIPLQYFYKLKEKGTLHFIGGKQEFLYRGYLSDVDMAFMVHGRSKGFALNQGCNGNIVKRFTFIGKACHAASAWDGKNALYAAISAINSANALRETFQEKDTIRFHPIIPQGGSVVNVIPNEVTVESQVRGFTLPSMIEANQKINLAFAAGAAAMGCRLVIDDMLHYSPRREDENLQDAFLTIARRLFPPEEIHTGLPHATGCTDMGDISTVMPVCHAFVGGGKGAGHTAEYIPEDPYTGCVINAKLQSGVLALLLSDGAARARQVIAERQIFYPSVQAYLDGVAQLSFHGDAVFYHPNGSVTLYPQKSCLPDET